MSLPTVYSFFIETVGQRSSQCLLAMPVFFIWFRSILRKVMIRIIIMVELSEFFAELNSQSKGCTYVTCGVEKTSCSVHFESWGQIIEQMTKILSSFLSSLEKDFFILYYLLTDFISCSPQHDRQIVTITIKIRTTVSVLMT